MVYARFLEAKPAQPTSVPTSAPSAPVDMRAQHAAKVAAYFRRKLAAEQQGQGDQHG